MSTLLIKNGRVMDPANGLDAVSDVSVSYTHLTLPTT
jgi:hypothetical protein